MVEGDDDSVTGYEQAMRHARNHRKDRFYQQCSCYFGDGEPDGFEVPKDIFSDLSAKSMAAPPRTRTMETLTALNK